MKHKKSNQILLLFLIEIIPKYTFYHIFICYFLKQKEVRSLDGFFPHPIHVFLNNVAHILITHLCIDCIFVYSLIKK